jgi:EmrB/QacA subfamily drug resistance transporter
MANPLQIEDKSLRILLWLVAIGFFMQTLDATIVNTTLPTMARNFGESPLRMQSVVVAYSLTMAMLIPASGWIADRFGTRRVYVASITLFVIGSIACAMSQTLTQLVMARVVQGLGGAFLLPVGRLAVLRAFPRERFLQAMSFIAIPGLVGPLVGPTLGGWLVEVANWRWVFLINIPVGLVGGIATLFYMQDNPRLIMQRFDIAGYLYLAFGMVAVSLAVDGVSSLGLKQAGVLVLLVFGMASLAAYWIHAAKKPDPIFSPRLFSIPTLSIGLLGNLFARLGSSCMPFLVPLLLQVSLNYSPLRAGLMMVPVALASMFVKRIATPLITRYGYRTVLLVNTMLVGIAMASFAFVSPEHPVWVLVVQLAAFGAVNSMQFTAMNTVALRDLDTSMASSGNSLLSMVQMLAMSMGVAAAGAVLAGFTGYFGSGGALQTLHSFQATFVCMGLITLASSGIFWQLSPAVRVVKKADATEASGQG